MVGPGCGIAPGAVGFGRRRRSALLRRLWKKMVEGGNGGFRAMAEGERYYLKRSASPPRPWVHGLSKELDPGWFGTRRPVAIRRFPCHGGGVRYYLKKVCPPASPGTVAAQGSGGWYPAVEPKGR